MTFIIMLHNICLYSVCADLVGAVGFFSVTSPSFFTSLAGREGGGGGGRAGILEIPTGRRAPTLII